MKIENWIEAIINGPTGFKSCEKHELMVHHKGRERSIGEWVIRCLANPDCIGSEQVLKAIQKHREKIGGGGTI